MSEPMGNLESRFWKRVSKEGDCWLWTGKLDVCGYGMLWVQSSTPTEVRAHRYSYELANGPIAPGLSVLHRCDVRRCVKPAHLFLGTQRDNIADCVAKGRTGNRSKQTHCLNGHAFDEANTRVDSHGYRVCRACHRSNQRAYLKAAAT